MGIISNLSSFDFHPACPLQTPGPYSELYKQRERDGTLRETAYERRNRESDERELGKSHVA